VAAGLEKTHASLALRAAVVVYFTALVGLPLFQLVRQAVADGPGALVRAIAAPVALHALWLTVWTAGLVAVVNAVMGTVIAWVLTQYRPVGQGVISAIVDLPLALPTLVVGVVWVALLGPKAALGGALERHGVPVLFTPAAIVIVLLFVTLPMIVRAVEPVLLDMDPSEEEAAQTLGASPRVIFFSLTMRALAPTISYGALQCFARALAEFGAVVVVSGNVALHTLSAPVYVYGEIESGATQSAAAVSVALLLAAAGVSYASRAIQRRGVVT